MRRAWLVVAGALAPATAGAEPATTVTAEAGAEADTNVQRIDQGPGIDAQPVSAPVIRFGAKVAHREKLAGGTAFGVVSALSRVVSDPAVSVENVAFLTADARWVHPIPKRQVAAGIGLTIADAIPLSDPIGARTFRNLGADGVLVLRSVDDRKESRATLTFAVGGRSFTYKPDHKFDWVGPTINARLDWTLWEGPGGVRTLELAGVAGAEARRYNSVALAQNCTPDDPQDPGNCSARTSITRQDRYQRVGVDLVWTSANLIAGGGYQVAVDDSNSFGQSFVRHRGTLSATTNLPGKLVGTALLTLQFDQFLDGLLVRADTQHQEFTNLEDENRSSIQVRLARPLSTTWTLESRFALWRDIGDNMTTFRRELAYVGAIYVR